MTQQIGPRFWSTALLVAGLVGGCSDSPTTPAPEIQISNLKSNVLGSYLDVCGGARGLTLTEFTFDFSVNGGVDLAADAFVNRLLSGSAPGNLEVLGQIAACSSGPCATARRACITAGRPTASGTLQVWATEPFQSQSSWTLEVRQNGQAGVRSNALTTIVSYPPQ